MAQLEQDLQEDLHRLRAEVWQWRRSCDWQRSRKLSSSADRWEWYPIERWEMRAFSDEQGAERSDKLAREHPRQRHAEQHRQQAEQLRQDAAHRRAVVAAYYREGRLDRRILRHLRRTLSNLRDALTTAD